LNYNIIQAKMYIKTKKTIFLLFALFICGILNQNKKSEETIMWPRWVRLISTLWVAFDSKKRKSVDYLWVLIILLLGPLLLPIYIATRPLLKNEKRPDCLIWNIIVAIENITLWLVGLAVAAVFVENVTMPKNKDVAEVKRAEIKAGSFLGLILFIILAGLEKTGFEAFKSHIEKKYFKL
jgi:hypothetical protein